MYHASVRTAQMGGGGVAASAASSAARPPGLWGTAEAWAGGGGWGKAGCGRTGRGEAGSVVRGAQGFEPRGPGRRRIRHKAAREAEPLQRVVAGRPRRRVRGQAGGDEGKHKLVALRGLGAERSVAFAQAVLHGQVAALRRVGGRGGEAGSAMLGAGGELTTRVHACAHCRQAAEQKRRPEDAWGAGPSAGGSDRRQW